MQTKHKLEMASHFYIPHLQRREKINSFLLQTQAKTHEHFLQITQRTQMFGRLFFWNVQSDNQHPLMVLIGIWHKM